MPVSVEILRHMFERILLIREVEKRISIEYSNEDIKCPVHLSLGQEAVAVGICSALDSSDVVFSNHRCHAHYLAKGGDLQKMISELYGRTDGCTGGWGGSMHLADPKASFIGSSSIVGGTIPIAVGAALNFKLKNEPRVSVVFFGDGATEEGCFYESLNFAALHKLPIVFVCENNSLAVDTPITKRQTGEIYKRGESLGICGQKVDGQDAVEVLQAAIIAKTKAVGGHGPSLIECMTHRWAGHVSPVFKDETDCPVDKLKQLLLSIDTPLGWFQQLTLNIDVRVDSVFTEAKKS